MATIQDILNSVENRLRELDEEIGVLNAARAALNGREPQKPRRPRTNVANKGRTARRNDAAAAAPAKIAAEQKPQAAAHASPTPAPKSPRPAQRKRPAKADRGLEIVPAGKLELLVSQNGGLTTSALAKLANADRDQVLTMLRELEAAGRIRRTGQRRATRWHVFTDEERIQERAAELVARSNSAA